MTQYPYMNPYLQSFYPYPQLQASQPTQQSPTSIIWVSGEREAAVYPVAPNNAVALWDSDAPVIYLKKADASGKPTMQAFDLVEGCVSRASTAARRSGRARSSCRRSSPASHSRSSWSA